MKDAILNIEWYAYAQWKTHFAHSICVWYIVARLWSSVLQCESKSVFTKLHLLLARHCAVVFQRPMQAVSTLPGTPPPSLSPAMRLMKRWAMHVSFGFTPRSEVSTGGDQPYEVHPELSRDYTESFARPRFECELISGCGLIFRRMLCMHSAIRNPPKEILHTPLVFISILKQAMLLLHPNYSEQATLCSYLMWPSKQSSSLMLL